MDSLNDDQESMTALEVETMNPLQPTTRRGEGGAGGDGSGVSDGVFLTWEDLWVTVSNGRKGSKSILQGAYVTQDETLITTLTVREAVYYSAQLQLPDSMSKSEKASYYVMSRIAALKQKDRIRRTIIASIHQPSSEVFQLLNTLCLLSSGKVIYFGPASAANEFFAFNGFPCPTLQNPSDHFLKTINKDFEKDLEQGNGKAMSTEEAITTIIKSYKSSINYQQVQRLVHEICKQDRGSLLMFISTFLTFMTIGGLPSFVEDMKFSHNLLFDRNMKWELCLPWLHRGSGHFLYFIIALFSCMMLVESLMMTVASIVPNFLMGIITGSGIQAIMSLGGGLFRLPNDLPGPFWKYPMYYISFHRYVYQGLFKNEFEGLTFPNNDQAGRLQEGSSTLSGEEILRIRWQADLSCSKWVDLAILLGMVVLYKLLFLVIIKTTEKAVISEEESTTTNEVPEASTQTFPPNNNGGEVAAEVIKILEVQRIA
ncbi:hypothetical protein GH714_011575 [Hevea brasiliensis]|uniref:ABC-2 type transporter domain-containing protein n=1 Tax=Hevea brasiliensis TaxID=3981 RepID=A0A6A6N0P8_HEVBR|nr:hypothetical protein GH714_011575 [Hevea brasiliensis]